jgi:glycosyltransferase involved in cell wall biosynthesis
LFRDFVILDDARIFGGGQQNALRLARFIAESLPSRAARVICPASSELAHHCRAAGIGVADADFPGLSALAPLRVARAVGRLRRLFASVGEAAIVGMSLRTHVYAHAASATLGRRVRIVHFLPEQDSAARLTTKVLLRRYGAVVVVGDDAARAYRELLPDVSVRGINNFMLPEEFESAAARRVEPPGEDPPVLGMLTRLLPEKGVRELVDELSENPDAWSELLVGGDRQDQFHAEEVEGRIAALGLDSRIRLLGHVTDLAAFFGKIDALVVPSVGNEGQPTVILEALAYGRPAIVRESIWSPAFVGLPVTPYGDATDLGDVVAHVDAATVEPDELVRRFGPAAAVEAIEAAAWGS